MLPEQPSLFGLPDCLVVQSLNVPLILNGLLHLISSALSLRTRGGEEIKNQTNLSLKIIVLPGLVNPFS